MEAVLSPFKIVGLVLIASGLFMMYIFPKYLFKNSDESNRPDSIRNKENPQQERTRKILFYSGIVDIILGLALLLGVIPFK